MGDGSVACMPLQQQQQHVTEKALCGANNGNGFNSKLVKVSDGGERRRKKKKKIVKVKKKIMKVKKREAPAAPAAAKKAEGAGKSELALDRVGSNDVESGEVEEGELGTLNVLENGELVPPEKLPLPPSLLHRRSEIENGEIVSERWKKGELKGEVVCGRWRKEEKGEHGSWRGGNGMKDEIEKGEFIPDRWHRGDMGKDNYSYNGRSRRYESGRDKGLWKSDRDRKWTPLSGRYAGDDFLRKKELNRSGSQHGKSAPRWESGQERNVRLCSKIVEEDNKNEHNNGRNHARDHSSGSRLKRHGNDSDSCDRKQHRDYAGLKSRRLSDDGSRHDYSEQYSRHSVERLYRNNSSKSSGDKYSSRRHEFSLSTRSAYDRHGRSPAHSERSPHDRARYYDHKERAPVRRSPYSRDKSPYSCEKSPHGHERSPYDRNCDRNRYHDHKLRSPTHADRSPQDRGRHHDHRDSTPNLVERSPLDRTRQNIHRETGSKTLSSEKQNSHHSCKDVEDNNIQKESNLPSIESQGERNVHDTNLSIDKDICDEPEKEHRSGSPKASSKASPCVEPPPEELPSMEEDMDICDTPPHVPVVTDSSSGKWFYLDYSGVEHGPSKLSDIKALVDDGVLMSDHFIKHLDSDRWLTVENAASPLAAQSFPSIMSDTITQLVNPPEAPGNLLADSGDTLQSGPESELLEDSVVASELLDDLHIDERVGVLLEGYDITPGRELESIKGILSWQ